MHVIFDMDGVILDTEQVVIDCWVEMAPHYDIDDIEFLKDTCRKCIGTNRDKTKETFLNAFGQDFHYDEFRAKTDELIHQRRAENGIPVKEGARRILDYLRDERIPIGLASSTRMVSVEKELKDAGLWDYFDAIVTGDMITNSKPAPDIYLEACKKLGCVPEETYAVEDSYNGVRSAHAAGMKVLMVPDILEPTEDIRLLCDGIFRNLDEVREYLNTSAGRLEFVPEADYANQMTQVVEPELVQHLYDGYCETAPGIQIHYQYYEKHEPKGTVVISHGFTESALKFHEMAWYFFQAGYQVFLVDHRGHASSSRECDDENVVHIRQFDDYVTDLHTVVTQKVKPISQGRPLYLYGHSMGGAISADYIGRYPEDFTKAVLTAPMIAANTGSFPAWSAKVLAALGKFFGQAKKMPFNYKPYDPQTDTYENAPDTSKARFEYYKALRQKDRRLITCAPSYSWVGTSMKLTKKLLSEEHTSRIKIPVLLFQADNDVFVLNPPQDEFISKLAQGRLIHVPGTKHEIYFSDDATLQAYVKEILDFYAR